VVLTGDPYLSGRHAEFLCAESGCTVMDLGSTNGTFLHGDRLAPHRPMPLEPGDEVRLGQTVFVLQPSAVSPQPSAEEDEVAEPESVPESGTDDSEPDS
jgi:pSer/pThr/pTyr-binding forkhead associated (FHA) protein